jgi:hypothetical protein
MTDVFKVSGRIWDQQGHVEFATWRGKQILAIRMTSCIIVCILPSALWGGTVVISTLQKELKYRKVEWLAQDHPDRKQSQATRESNLAPEPTLCLNFLLRSPHCVCHWKTTNEHPQLSHLSWNVYLNSTRQIYKP